MTTQTVSLPSIGTYFASLPDPRHQRNRKHRLVDIVVVSVCAMICNSDGPTAIHRWATERQDWLRQHLGLQNGIPSRDGIRRVLMALQPHAFQTCFQAWIASVIPADKTDTVPVIAIDGKTCRGSHDHGAGLGPLHIVSAWATRHGIALGQVATDEKSNEITAIPELLKQLDLDKTRITIDAMGCQKEITRTIVEGGGDFVIAVKDNQPRLHKAIAEHFQEPVDRGRTHLSRRCYVTTESRHGRVDERTYVVSRVPAGFACARDWPWVKAIGRATRTTRHADGRITTEVRYYILGRYLTGSQFAEASRGHWGIEAMHWVLDVNFREDESRTRDRILGNNLSWLRRFAITLLKRHPMQDSLRGKAIRCLMNTVVLEEVLFGQ